MELLPASRRLTRLRTAVSVRGVGDQPSDVTSSDPVAMRVARHLELAKAAAKDRRISEGWGHLHEAERTAVELYDADRLEALVIDLRREAEDSDKFKEWRRNAILEHLKPKDDEKITAWDVQHALKLRSEHFDNVYSKIDETLYWVGLASVSIVVILLLLVAGGNYAWLPLGRQSSRLILLVFLMGALGGALSTGLSLAKGSNKPIPELLMQGSVTAFRPLLGGAMAVVTLFLIKAGLLDFLGAGLDAKVWLISSFGFLAGSSERWFLGIVGELTKKRIDRADKPEGGKRGQGPAPGP